MSCVWRVLPYWRERYGLPEALPPSLAERLRPARSRALSKVPSLAAAAAAEEAEEEGGGAAAAAAGYSSDSSLEEELAQQAATAAASDLSDDGAAGRASCSSGGRRLQLVASGPGLWQLQSRMGCWRRRWACA